MQAVSHDLDLLRPATEDRLHQAYRGAAMPGTLVTVDHLRSLGLAAVVSGAGPSILVLSDGPLDLAAVRAAAGIGWDVRSLPVDRVGARVTGERVPVATE